MSCFNSYRGSIMSDMTGIPVCVSMLRSRDAIVDVSSFENARSASYPRRVPFAFFASLSPSSACGTVWHTRLHLIRYLFVAAKRYEGASD